MDPVTGWAIAKAAGEISKKLYEFGKGLKDHEAKQKVDEIVDKLRELKQSASELEDENRELRELLRFKKDDFEFQNPYWIEKSHPERPLCPKCFAKQLIGPLTEEYELNGPVRRCLACDALIRKTRFDVRSNHSGPNDEWS
jgi:hypothetical protein